MDLIKAGEKDVIAILPMVWLIQILRINLKLSKWKLILRFLRLEDQEMVFRRT